MASPEGILIQGPKQPGLRAIIVTDPGLVMGQMFEGLAVGVHEETKIDEIVIQPGEVGLAITEFVRKVNDDLEAYFHPDGDLPDDRAIVIYLHSISPHRQLDDPDMMELIARDLYFNQELLSWRQKCMKEIVLALRSQKIDS